MSLFFNSDYATNVLNVISPPPSVSKGPTLVTKIMEQNFGEVAENMQKKKQKL